MSYQDKCKECRELMRSNHKLEKSIAQKSLALDQLKDKFQKISNSYIDCQEQLLDKGKSFDKAGELFHDNQELLNRALTLSETMYETANGLKVSLGEAMELIDIGLPQVNDPEYANRVAKFMENTIKRHYQGNGTV